MKSHTNEKPFSCDKCDNNFANAEELNTHEVTHTNEKPFSCNKCDNNFANAEELNTHEVKHTNEKPFSCDKCDKKFYGKTSENEVVIKSEEDLARTFNHFFPAKVEKIERNIPVFDIDPTSKLKEKLKGRNLNFQFKLVTESQVRKAIMSVKSKTSSGVDFVSTQVLKMAVDVITLPLTWIINNSLESGIFPTCWKIAKCIPLFKNK